MNVLIKRSAYLVLITILSISFAFAGKEKGVMLGSLSYTGKALKNLEKDGKLTKCSVVYKVKRNHKKIKLKKIYLHRDNMKFELNVNFMSRRVRKLHKFETNNLTKEISYKRSKERGFRAKIFADITSQSTTSANEIVTAVFSEEKHKLTSLRIKLKNELDLTCNLIEEEAALTKDPKVFSGTLSKVKDDSQSNIELNSNDILDV
jgi:hypothetical protein